LVAIRPKADALFSLRVLSRLTLSRPGTMFSRNRVGELSIVENHAGRL